MLGCLDTYWILVPGSIKYRQQRHSSSRSSVMEKGGSKGEGVSE